MALFTDHALAARVAHLERHVAELHAAVQALRERLEHSRELMPAKIAAELDDLRGALSTMQQANRREFGKLWARLATTPRADELKDLNGGDDTELAALLALQSAGPKAHGS
jgi:hypothetical protein